MLRIDKNGGNIGRGIVWAEPSGTVVAEFAMTCDVAVIPIGCAEMHGPQKAAMGGLSSAAED